MRLSPRQGRVAAAAEEQGDVSPAEKAAGRATYRPSTYSELITDAANSVIAALGDGHPRMEVEFPAISGGDGYKGSSDLYIDTNTQLALAGGKKVAEATGKRVHIVLPDAAEYRRSAKMFKAALESAEGRVTLGHLGEHQPPLGLSALGSLFGGPPDAGAGSVPELGGRSADVFVAINGSAVELADLEAYAEQVVGARTLVAWNMELDTLRADLGLLGFPPKDLQYRFLSQFRPVFYIRQRDYAKSVAVSPFIINYSGCLFREYPGPWQVMLRQDNGVYACVAEDGERRYGLGEFKRELMGAMGLDTEAEGSTMAFLRSGYKTSTWWEDDEELEQSNSWRS